jgi:hypothetical protein
MSALCTDLQDGDLWNRAELKTERDKMVDRDTQTQTGQSC